MNWPHVSIELINNPDPCATVLLIILLATIGSKMIASRPELQKWGYRVASAVLVAYAIYGIHTFHPTTADAFLSILMRSLVAFGLALGLSWVVLAIQGFVHAHTFQRAHESWRRSAERRARERQAEQRRLERLAVENQAEEERRRQLATAPQPLPRSERVKQAIDQAKSDYDTECAVLRAAAGLDTDELETALSQCPHQVSAQAEGSHAMTPMINTLTCGSTRSGKTWSELRKLVEAAEMGYIALVVLDPHRDSLATPLLEHLVARGMQRRVLFERLVDVHRVLGWDFLPPSFAQDSLDRMAENEANIRAFTDVLCRRRQVETLATTPLIEEWLLNVTWLYIEQDQRLPLTDMQFAFDPKHPTFKRMLDHCMNSDIAAKFRAIARGTTRRSQFGAASRLITAVCGSPAFAVRCTSRPTFDLARFLGNRAGILIVEGGGASLSDDAMRTMMGTVALQTIQYVRTRSRPSPPVILAMDEATNAGLIGASGYEARALAECAKMGLSIHILVQQLNFPSPAITESVLANTLVHEWFFNANPMVCRKAATDLGDRNYANEIRTLKVGERFVKDRHRAFREYVKPLEDPWGFEGLAKKKAERALVEIQKRPEYRTPELRTRAPNTITEPPQNESREEDNPNLGI